MTDRKPPRFDGDERDTLLTLLRFQRESLVRKLDSISDEAARSSPVASGTSLLWLVRHLAMAETLWLLRRFAALDVPVPDGDVARGDTVAAAVSAYRAVWSRADDVVRAAPSLDEPCRGLEADQAPATLRWVLAHLLEETARHAGHADILRELLDGQTGR
jgi:uncharacterized damage-inducible protein DinB